MRIRHVGLLAAAGFWQKPEVSPFEAGMLSRVGLDTSQNDAVVPRELRQQCRLGFSCLCLEPSYPQLFTAVLQRLVHLTL